MIKIQDVEHVKKTSRSRGAVGAKAVVPRMAASYSYGAKILDYGCGKDAAHVKDLEARGYDIVGHDYWHGKPLDTKEKFDVVYASNVFNTHPSLAMSTHSIIEMKSVIKRGGIAFINLPQSPRYFWKSTVAFRAFLRFHFDTVEEIGERVWKLTGPVCGWRLRCA